MSENALQLKLENKAQLYGMHMPFIQGGGVFVPTSQAYELGDRVSLALELVEEGQTHQVEGQVVWKTPLGAQANMTAGVGIQLTGEAGQALQKLINTALADYKSDAATATM